MKFTRMIDIILIDNCELCYCSVFLEQFILELAVYVQVCGFTYIGCYFGVHQRTLKLNPVHLSPRYCNAPVKMSLVMRKPAFCICENKGADQLCGNREAGQRLCFRYTDSTIPLLPKSEILSLLPSSVTVQPG